MKKLNYLVLFLVGFLFIGLASVKANGYSEDFAKLFPGGKFTVNSVPITNMDEYQNYFYPALWEKIEKHDLSHYNIDINCNETYTVCSAYMWQQEWDNDLGGYVTTYEETHDIQFVYNYNPKLKTELDKYLAKAVAGALPIPGGGFEKLYTLTDLSLVNYYDSLTGVEVMSWYNTSINYIGKLRRDFENSNVTYTFTPRAGDDMPLQDYSFGSFVVLFGGVKYGTAENIGVRNNHVIYVPTGTANTTEALIAAAKKRIKDYLGKDVKIEVGGLRLDLIEDFEEEYDWSVLGSEALMGDYYYNVTLGGKVIPFVIMRDSSKMEVPEYLTRDMLTDILVTTNAVIPLDTNITVSEILNNDLFKTKLGRTNLYTVDINLNSSSTEKKITKLPNGKFEVAIPIPASLNGKNLIVEYIAEDGTIEKHAVTVKNGMAYFETDHFSTYSLGELLSSELNPKTIDDIYKYVSLGIVSLVGLVSVAIYINKKRFN